MTARVRGPVREPVRLGARRRLAVYVIAGGAWTTGALWLVFHYFLQRKGDFGPAPHPLEHWWLTLHGAFAFGALWTLGLLSASHILGGWSTGRRRWSGGLLLAFVTTLAVSGYLLYYLGDEIPRKIASLIHWIMGLSSILFFVFHRIKSTTSTST